MIALFFYKNNLKRTKVGFGKKFKNKLRKKSGLLSPGI